ncbi:hypothetical protein [Amycolatopsis methanolica]|uniref:Antibiotic biosynthesis monooxygenase n=2 Tax=Amycolatopsis methanolica group TaxID=2893674 RepID=A0A076MVM7_AMYME|nr:hypothetical protein [Amycolatopsis methanolica]AIJ24754.1 antibiotic biosynthesis monooxygenase [Amycolatopsis methanolica 239]
MQSLANTFVLYEKYTDASDYEEHRATETSRSYVLGEALPELAERSVADFEVLD